MNHKLLLSLHIMDEPKFKIHKIHNRRRSREQFKIQNSKFKIQKGVLLKNPPISLGETILRFMVFPLFRNRESTIFAA